MPAELWRRWTLHGGLFSSGAPEKELTGKEKSPGAQGCSADFSLAPVGEQQPGMERLPHISIGKSSRKQGRVFSVMTIG